MQSPSDLQGVEQMQFSIADTPPTGQHEHDKSASEQLPWTWLPQTGPVSAKASWAGTSGEGSPDVPAMHVPVRITQPMPGGHEDTAPWQAASVPQSASVQQRLVDNVHWHGYALAHSTPGGQHRVLPGAFGQNSPSGQSLLLVHCHGPTVSAGASTGTSTAGTSDTESTISGPGSTGGSPQW